MGDLEVLEKNVLIVGNPEEINSIVDNLQKSSNLKYKLVITIVNSFKELASLLSNNSNKVDLLCILDNIDIKQEEITQSIYQTNNLKKPYTIFINSINNDKLNYLFISKTSIYTGKNKSDFIIQKLDFYSNIEKNFSEDYFSGITSDYSLFDLFLIIEKLNKTGVLNVKINNSNSYFEFYFIAGKLSSAFGNNGYFPVSNISAIKEFFKENNYKNSNFEFLSDVNVPDIHFKEATCETISNVYKSIKLPNLDTKNESIVKYDDIRKTLALTNKNQYQEDISKKEIRKTIIIDKKSKDDIISKKGGYKGMVNSIDLNKAIEIAEDVYWVSHRDPKSLLQLNTYLRVFRKDSKMINLVVDPGPLQYFSFISKKISSVIKDVSRVNMYSVNHQDPDVGTNATFLVKMNPKSLCLCTEDTWRLFRYIDVPKTNYKNVYSFESKAVTLSTDPSHVIEFIPTPYCHFVGAFGLYDRKNRVLFTGDLFGGLNPANNMELFATEDHWDGIKTFHQIYMPSKRAVQNAIDNIRSLSEPPLMIVPQHGAILVGEIMEQFINRLYHLDVGVDLFNKNEQNNLIPAYLDLMNELFVTFSERIGVENLNRVFNFSNKNQELMYFVDMDENGIKNIYSDPEQALNVFLKTISKFEDYSIVAEMKTLAIKEALLRRIPIHADIYSQEASEDEEEDSTLFGQAKQIENKEEKEEDLFV